MSTDAKVLHVLVTWRQGFSQIFVFLGFFFLLENFYVGQDGAKWCDALQHAVCGGWGKAPHATGGGLGVLPQKFFCKYKLWDGHFRAISKSPWKSLIRLFTEIGKKRFLPQNKVEKGFKGFPGRPEWCVIYITSTHRVLELWENEVTNTK